MSPQASQEWSEAWGIVGSRGNQNASAITSVPRVSGDRLVGTGAPARHEKWACSPILRTPKHKTTALGDIMSLCGIREDGGPHGPRWPGQRGIDPNHIHPGPGNNNLGYCASRPSLDLSRTHHRAWSPRLHQGSFENMLPMEKPTTQLSQCGLQPAAPFIDCPQDHQPALSVPRHEDSTGEVIATLTAIVDAVRAGQSITEHTTDSAESPEMIARNQMPPLEYMAWTTFKQGQWRLPDVDWHENQLPPPTSSKSLKTAHRRAEALNRLYETDQAHEGHVTWVTQNKIEFLPMIKAMARVIGAERNQVGGGKWRAAELANLQLINRILSISTQVYQKRKSEVLRSKVAETQQVLGNYRRTLRKSALTRASEEVMMECDDRSRPDSEIVPGREEVPSTIHTYSIHLLSAAFCGLSLGNSFKAFAIAANTPAYGFCSDLMPSVEEKVSTTGANLNTLDFMYKEVKLQVYAFNDMPRRLKKGRQAVVQLRRHSSLLRSGQLSIIFTLSTWNITTSKHPILCFTKSSDDAILVDFDSCSVIGEPLPAKRGSIGALGIEELATSLSKSDHV
ncbi:hypothetical protein B7494_g3396 [Chlorociboria aeruginascens]|nr:hypothetical protein B7494_g3396 [Chlorociboria aeruginascens]